MGMRRDLPGEVGGGGAGEGFGSGSGIMAAASGFMSSRTIGEDSLTRSSSIEMSFETCRARSIGGEDTVPPGAVTSDLSSSEGFPP